MHPNTRKALVKLEIVAKAIASLPTTMALAYSQKIKGMAKPVVDDRFKGKGNKRFVPLSKDYAKQKQKDIGKKPILVRSGLLRLSVTMQHHQITQSGDLATVVFSDLPDYAEYHHQGVPHKNLPMRSPVQPDEADIIRIEAYATRRLKALMGNTSPGQQSQQSGNVSGV